MRTIIRTLLVTLVFFLTLVVIVTCLDCLITTNVSISEPLGYYLTLPLSHKIKRNDKYLICINDHKYLSILQRLGLPSNVLDQCKSGSPYLIKQVAGVPGDAVQITQSGVLINNHLQSNSQSFTTARGIPLYPLPVNYQVTLGSNEYFVLGTTLHSVDSRYFGIIKQEQLHKRAILIFTKDKI